MPKAAEMIDPQQRMMLEISWTALEDAGIVPDPQNVIGIWAGTYTTSYHINNVLTHPKRVRETGSFQLSACLLYTSPSPRDGLLSRMPSSA